MLLSDPCQCASCFRVSYSFVPFDEFSGVKASAFLDDVGDAGLGLHDFTWPMRYQLLDRDDRLSLRRGLHGVAFDNVIRDLDVKRFTPAYRLPAC
jgi:hypothetical protein